MAIQPTLVGKALVAFLPEEELDAVIRHLDFRQFTP
jgi:DNA-binding IclR family transcriptional regulator